ncbi:MAG: DUF935 family protein [Bdellovibrionaceae bacterium]|nr:DUF935 family protein [Pseudobdellovibrionaceae bacterium]
MLDLVASPFTGNVFARKTPARLKASVPQRAARLNPLLQRILRPQVFGNWQTVNKTPQEIETILRGAMGGNHVQQWELFDLMADTWPRLQKNMDELIQGVIAMDWKLEAWAEEDQPPSDTAKEYQQVISAAVWQMNPPPDEDLNGFEQLLADICSAWLVGLSVTEIIWEWREVGAWRKGVAAMHGLGASQSLRLEFQRGLPRPERIGRHEQLYFPLGTIHRRPVSGT